MNKNKIIGTFFFILIVIGIFMAIFCNPGWIKLAGLIMATISLVFGIDFFADEI